MPQGVVAAELAAAGPLAGAVLHAAGLQFCPRRQIEWFGAGGGREGERDLGDLGIWERMKDKDQG